VALTQAFPDFGPGHRRFPQVDAASRRDTTEKARSTQPFRLRSTAPLSVSFLPPPPPNKKKGECGRRCIAVATAAKAAIGQFLWPVVSNLPSNPSYHQIRKPAPFLDRHHGLAVSLHRPDLDRETAKTRGLGSICTLRPVFSPGTRCHRSHLQSSKVGLEVTQQALLGGSQLPITEITTSECCWRVVFMGTPIAMVA